MKKKHQIETIDDIKYCEEHGLIIFSDKRGCSFGFLNNVWCQCVGKFVCFYNSSLNIKEDQLYYFEEQEQQEVDGKDIGKLCWFYEIDDKRCYRLSVLMEISNEAELKFYSDSDRYSHCRPLTKKEIKEFMEKAE